MTGERDRSAGAHPDANALAAYADATLPHREREALDAHLRACARCRGAVEYATRAVAARPDRWPASEPDAVALARARAFVDPRASERARPAARPAAAWRLATALGVIALAATMGIDALWPKRFDPDAQEVAPITRLLVQRSEAPGAVYPGVESRVGGAVEHRTAGSARGAGADSALARMARRGRASRLDREQARWLVAGYLASDQLPLARSTLAIVSPRLAGDPDLRILSALLEARVGDGAKACRMLEQVVRDRPSSWAARYDLAVALAWSGRLADAARELDELEPRTDHAGQRAKIEQLRQELAALRTHEAAPRP